MPSKLKFLDGLGKFLDRFSGRILAVVFGVIAIMILKGPLTNALQADPAKLVSSGQYAVTTPNVVTVDEKARGGEAPAKGEANPRPEPSTDTSRVDESTPCQVRAWSYGIQVLGNIATLCAVLWALLALVRSDQRD